MADAESFCGAKMVLALMNAGCDVTVLTIDPALEGYPLDDSSVWRPAIEVSRPIKPVRSLGKVCTVLCAIRYQTSIDARWIGAVVAEARSLHRQRKFDLVYSRSLPMIAHVAGYWCAQILGLPWVASINDPWDYHMFPGYDVKPTSMIRKSVSKQWLLRTLGAATLITYPSRRLHDFHIRLTGRQHRGALMEHIGWTRSVSPNPQPCFQLVHAGRLVADRSASGLLAGLKQFLSLHPPASSRTKLVLVGPKDRRSEDLVMRLELQNTVTSTGRVSYEECLKYICGASVCVLVEGNVPDSIYLPSKFADYVAARKPVLALSPGRGTIADLLPCRGIVRVDPDDPNGIARAIGQFYPLWMEGKVQRESPPDELVARFAPETVAAKFLSAVLESLPCGGRRTVP
jgi:hypothetical protein